jgi:NAD(P)-dependent dehydrogenase (short-subunit alcohol dehydrogenase family)
MENPESFLAAYDFTGKTIAVTGGGGVLGSELCRGLAGCNANVVILGRSLDKAGKVLDTLSGTRGKHRALAMDVLDKNAIERVARTLLDDYGSIDGLINGAGGNDPMATTSADQSFFDIPAAAWDAVQNLNLQGTLLPTQVLGRAMAKQKHGVILNVTSLSAFRALTRVPAYSAAKAAVSNFTSWLAVHLAEEYSPNLRVNAIAPGFFLTEQNRFLLTDQATGGLTARGNKIIAHTPARRFGTPRDLVGATLWLLSPASEFVTGIVVPIDGGFSAFGGV